MTSQPELPPVTDRAHFDTLVASLRSRDSVAACLPYPGAAAIPGVIEHLAREHEDREGLAWDDVCPAYGLAVITHGNYAVPGDEPALEALWNEVGEDSTLVWTQVRELVIEAWHWLDALRSQGQVS